MKHSDYNKGTSPTTGDARPVYTTVVQDDKLMWWGRTSAYDSSRRCTRARMALPINVWRRFSYSFQFQWPWVVCMLLGYELIILYTVFVVYIFAFISLTANFTPSTSSNSKKIASIVNAWVGILSVANLHKGNMDSCPGGTSKRAAKMRVYVHFSSKFLNINFQYLKTKKFRFLILWILLERNHCFYF